MDDGYPALKKVTNEGLIESAKVAVTLAIGLVGIMALWLGLMKIAEQSGLISRLSQFVRPVMTRLFPDIPPDHPAMGAMVMISDDSVDSQFFDCCMAVSQPVAINEIVVLADAWGRA